LFFVVVKLPGIFVDTLGGTLLGAAIVGIANAAIRPLFSLIAIPFNPITLGWLTFFTNVFTPMMVVKTLPGIQISSLLTSVASILLMTACSFTLSKVIQDR
jgi:putative membrane protein